MINLLSLAFSLLLAAGISLSGCGPRLIGALSTSDQSVKTGILTPAVDLASVAGLRGFQSVMGDFDGDGDLDLAIVNPTTNAVSISLNNGAGTFGAPTSYTVSGTPVAIAAADLNLNGCGDLLVTTASGAIEVLLGSCNGAFGAATAFPSAGASSATGIAVGDLDGNGVPDVVSADFSGGLLIVRMGAIAGTLGAATTYPAGTTPAGIVLADFNRDGRLDVAITQSGDNSVSIRLGSGTGTFGAATSYTVGHGPLGLTTGDFNRDGRLDLAVANSESGTVSVLLGSGTGTFGAATDYSVGTKPVSVAAADFNVDGKLDLIVANHDSANASRLLGVGNGTFGAAASSATSANPMAAATGDFNRDGEPDALIVEAADTTPTLIAGVDPGAPGTFADSANYAMGGGSDPRSVAYGDFDRDGDLDAAVSDLSSGNVRVFFNNGLGVFAVNQNLAAGTNTFGMKVADMDRDGDLDLVLVTRGDSEVKVYKNDGTGTFGPAAFSTASYNAGAGNPNDVVIADLNRDGAPDVAVTGIDYANEAVVEVYFNNGSGTITIADQILPAVVNTNEVSWSIQAADFDRDGDIDLVYTMELSHLVGVALNDGTGHFGPTHVTTSTGASSGPEAITLADLNRDGKLDLLIAGSGNAAEGIFMLGVGNGTFGAAVHLDGTGAATGRFVLPFDFNFDGLLDLVLVELAAVGNRGGEIFTGNGTTAPALAGNLPGGTCAAAYSGLAEDLNGDGRKDLVLTCSGDNNISVMLAN